MGSRRDRKSSLICVFNLPLLVAFLALFSIASGTRLLRQKSETPPPDSTLQMVHLLFRHGARTPVNTYPNDPYINETFYPYGWGQLTNKGKMELYQMGKWLKKRYQRIMGDYFQNDLVLAQSSASTRTLMSMGLVLAGMFPPKQTPMEWSRELNWQPIPIYSEPLETDTKLRMTVNCPRYEECLEEVFQLPEVKSDLQQYAKIFEELRNLTGDKMETPEDMNSIYHSFWTESEYGLRLPGWSKAYYPDKMEYIAAQHYVYNAYTPEMQKIKGGPLVEEIITNMQQKMKGIIEPRKRKIFMYCAHDWTVANVLMSLGAWRHQMPNFGALAAIELHKNPITKQHYIEIYFLNDVSKKPQKLTMHGCEFQCPIEDFIKLTKGIIPDKPYEELCRPLKKNEETTSTSTMQPS